MIRKKRTFSLARHRFTKMLLSVFVAASAALTVLPLRSTTVHADDTYHVDVSGNFYDPGVSAVLARIKEIRQEAINNGYVKWAAANDSKSPWTTSIEPQTEAPSSEWSSELEGIAQIRAAEMSIRYGHLRPNGTYVFSMSGANGVQSSNEIIAWQSRIPKTSGAELMDAVNAWYSEIQYVVKQSDGSFKYTNDESKYQYIGHYQALVNPENHYVGMAAFTRAGFYDMSSVGEFCQLTSGLNSTPLSNGNKTISVEISTSNVAPTSVAISGAPAGNKLMLGGKATLQATAVVSGAASPVTSGVVWTTSNAAAVTVDGAGNVVAAGAGSAVITATVGGKSASVTLSVVGIGNVTAPGTVEIDSGTNPATVENLLPASVAAKYTDGSSGSVAVAWDYSKVTKTQYGARNGGTITVHGTIAGYAAGVDGTITVKPAAVSSVDGYNTTATVENGQVPALSPTANVHWSNGDTEQKTISWTAKSSDAYKLHNGGTVIVEGTVETGEATARKVQCTVTVKPATITSVAALEKKTVYTDSSLEEIAGQLPKTVKATWSDGTQTDEAITWPDASALADLSTAGSGKTVKGTIVGNQEVTLSVDVLSAELS